MDEHDVSRWQHAHDFHESGEKGEKRTRWVVALTAFMMVAEIAAGWVFGSMALLADGWHMGTHVAALSITLFAYAYARKHAADPHFSFGTGKVGVLGGYTSAVVLGIVALLMAVESIDRMIHPVDIRFNEAILVACLGLAVNLVSAWLLKDDHHHHHHDHDHDHDHDHHHDEAGSHHDHAHTHDHNLRAAYMHVLADALTSVLAIIALFTGKYLNWNWMDAFMGIVGAFVITRWAMGLMKDSSRILLDRQVNTRALDQVRSRLESVEGARVSDLHLWPVGSNHQALIASIVATQPREAEEYKERLKDIAGLDHITIEVNKRGN